MGKLLSKIRSITHLFRIKHWVKNLFIFVPAFFAAKILDFSVFSQSLLVFISFCFISSAVYIVNDIMDQDEDKLHPEKSNRPIASGEISSKVAMVYAILLAGLSLTIAYTLNFNVVVILLVYLCINLLYSTVLKNFVIVDLVIIGLGFLLRIYAGGLATKIPISDWLSIMVFLISLFMALAKRRDDALLYQKTKLDVRKNIKFYNLQFIDSTLSMLAGVVIVAYIMYSMSPALKERVGSEYIFMTSLFVIIGVMKYLHRIFSENEKGSPVNVLFSDRLIQLSLIGWLLTFYVLIYISF